MTMDDCDDACDVLNDVNGAISAMTANEEAARYNDERTTPRGRYLLTLDALDITPSVDSE